MAEKPGSNESPVALRQKISRSRELVVRDVGGLRYELDFTRKFKQTFQRNPVVWVGAAMALGLVVALLRARPREIFVNAAGKRVRSPSKSLLESGALLGALKLGLSLAQPMVLRYLAKKVKGDGRSRPPRQW
jgi:hypothetical protein